MIKKLCPLLFLIILFSISCKRDPEAPQNENGNGPPPYCENIMVPVNDGLCGEPAITPLVAGKYAEVGYVQAEIINGELFVSYVITKSDWRLTLTHLEVKEVYTDMPINGGGNPKIGHFEYSADLGSGVFKWTSPGININNWNNVDIAAHAEVIQAEFSLSPEPGNYSMTATINNPNDSTYISIVLGDSSGNYSFFDTWCLDFGGPIHSSTNYDIYLHKAADLTNTDYSCLSVEMEENMDLVQYLVNQDYPCASKYDIQVAIWNLVNNNPPSSPTSTIPYDPNCVQTILNDVFSNGEGFIPDPCIDIEGLVVDGYCDPSVSGQPQVQTLLLLRKPGCPTGEIIGSETAWACGTGFPGNNWAMYFSYCIN